MFAEYGRAMDMVAMEPLDTGPARKIRLVGLRASALVAGAVLDGAGSSADKTEAIRAAVRRYPVETSRARIIHRLTEMCMCAGVHFKASGRGRVL